MSWDKLKVSDLLAAYRFYRNSLYPPKPAAALRAARESIAEGKSRIGSSPWRKPYAPVSWQEPRGNTPRRSREMIGFVEDPASCGIRIAAEKDLPGIDHNGWYTTPDRAVYRDGSGLCYGVVGQLPGRNGKARYVPGFAYGGQEGYFFDFADIREVDCRDYDNSSDGIRDAAKTADSMALYAAEDEMEYQTAYDAGAQWAETKTELLEAKAELKADLASRREMKNGMRTGSIAVSESAWKRACLIFKANAERHLEAMTEARDKMRDLAQGDWGGLIFYPDEKAKNAFCEGAGISTYPA